jgi:hypothetical protein
MIQFTGNQAALPVRANIGKYLELLLRPALTRYVFHGLVRCAASVLLLYLCRVLRLS